MRPRRTSLRLGVWPGRCAHTGGVTPSGATTARAGGTCLVSANQERGGYFVNTGVLALTGTARISGNSGSNGGDIDRIDGGA